MQRIAAITLLVRDYDEAIAYYTGVLDFTLLEDTPLGDGKRWVRVAPSGSDAPALLLAEPADESQRPRIGTVAVFQDLYGNERDLIEPAPT